MLPEAVLLAILQSVPGIGSVLVFVWYSLERDRKTAASVQLNHEEWRKHDEQKTAMILKTVEMQASGYAEMMKQNNERIDKLTDAIEDLTRVVSLLDQRHERGDRGARL